jgi:hypothetical protein
MLSILARNSLIDNRLKVASAKRRFLKTKKNDKLSSQFVDKPRTDQLDFVVCARIRTVAQFESYNYQRFPATVRPEADN